LRNAIRQFTLFSRFKIRTRLFIAFAVLLLVMLTINIVTLQQMRELAENQGMFLSGQLNARTKGASHFDRIMLAQSGIALIEENAERTLEMLSLVHSQELGLGKFNQLAQAQYNTRNDINQVYATLEHELDTEQERALFLTIQQVQKQYVSVCEAMVNEVRKGNQGNGSALSTGQLLPKLSVYVHALNEFIQLEKTLEKASQQENAHRYLVARNSLVLLLAIAVITSAIFAWRGMSVVIHSINAINTAARTIANGQFYASIPIHGSDEIAELSVSFNRMVVALGKNRRQLMAEKKNLEDKVRERTREISLANAELIEVNRNLEQVKIQLIQSEKMASIGQLAAGVAHEINTPIGYIYSNMEALRSNFEKIDTLLSRYEGIETQLDDTPASAATRAELSALKRELQIDFVREDVADIVQENNEGLVRVRDIVQSLKDFSQIEQSSAWQFSDVNKGIEGALKLIGSDTSMHMRRVNVKQSPRKNGYQSDSTGFCTEIITDFGDLPLVECQLSQLNQSITHIVLNAVYAIGDQDGKIIIRTRAAKETISIEIIDNGVGISAENISRIFDPFFTTKPIGQGTGLGLSVAYGMVNNHGGELTVSSISGNGAHFLVVLPIKQTRQ